MASQPRAGVYTFGDFLELVREDQKADLLDGVIYMASPENIEHNDQIGWLSLLFRAFVEERNLGGQVTINRVAYRLAPHDAPEPDIAYVRGERAHLIKRGYVDGPPDLVVEFVSPESVDRDYEHKRARYEEAGVGEYWILDSDERRAVFLIRGAAGYEEALLRDGLFHSRVIPGFFIDPNWLWQRPLPKAMDILRRILGSA